MKQIRRGIFETNSSSSHSIVVTKNDIQYCSDEIVNNAYIRDGKLVFWSDNLTYERTPFEVLHTFIEKCAYCIAQYSNYPDKRKEVEGIIKKYLKGCFTISYPCEFDNNGDRIKFYGSIDHESCGLIDKFLELQKIALEEFLINKKYVVIVDGDEYCVWNDLKNSGLIDSDNILEEYPDLWKGEKL